MSDFALQGPIPNHVGIIMDGNGRWAKSQGLSRSKGHEEGMKTAKMAAKTASDLGIKVLSLYIFSTENWKRAEDEVSFLMFLIKNYLRKEFQFYKENRIRIVHSGNFETLPPEIGAEIQSIVEETSTYTGLILNLAINYGGRDEMLRAMNRAMNNAVNKQINLKTQPILEADFKSCLDVPNLPDVDLIIRTGGDMRLSNFLLWQSNYAELFFSKKYWPEWKKEDFMEALTEFQHRQRRFGGLNE